METLIHLIREMFSIGSISFGGGWSVVGVLKDRLISLGWADNDTFARYLTLAQMTPGPVALNSATLVGMEQAGILGAALATLSVISPGILVIIAGRWILKKELVKQAPIVRALGLASVALLGFTLFRLAHSPTLVPWMIPITLLTVWLNVRTKVHSLLIVALGIGLGMASSLIFTAA